MFITLEGGEGSGKTTVARTVADHLRTQGYDVLLTREPGGTALGDALRTLLLDARSQASVSPEAELLMFCAARAQIVTEVLRPHLAKGGVVLCDRYADSTLAYQGYGRGLSLDTLRTILTFATGGLWPTLTLFFDLLPEQGLQRRRPQEWDRLDALELDFHHRVRVGYQTLMAQEPARWRLIDASQPLEQVCQDVISTIQAALPSHSS
jgi:dTMP kinase